MLHTWSCSRCFWCSSSFISSRTNPRTHPPSYVLHNSADRPQAASSVLSQHSRSALLGRYRYSSFDDVPEPWRGCQRYGHWREHSGDSMRDVAPSSLRTRSVHIHADSSILSRSSSVLCILLRASYERWRDRHCPRQHGRTRRYWCCHFYSRSYHIPCEGQRQLHEEALGHGRHFDREEGVPQRPLRKVLARCGGLQQCALHCRRCGNYCYSPLCRARCCGGQGCPQEREAGLVQQKPGAHFPS
mmetsp:Transcript_8926/g.36860  ORF Transcript_8926/g.36860 Transcript_8926/m.36860 type:complete len:244 (+) Transcript_8926:641-1372(+)